MNSITQLKDTQRDKRLLIIGRGHSVIDFRFDLLPDDVMTMAVNVQPFEVTKYGKNLIPNYLIYIDIEQGKFIDQYGLIESVLLLSEKKNACKRTDYYYDSTIVKTAVNSTVIIALQVAQIIGFREAYLIGVDMKVENNQARYFGNSLGTCVSNGFDRKFKKMIDDFWNIKWEIPTFNCNAESGLKQFPYKLPWS
jgi:hypothetical protein